MEITFATICIIIFQLYYLLIVLLNTGWKKCEAANKTSQILPNLSCIIALRNEEENIKHLLQNLAGLNYPKNQVEFILVNDHSTDQTKNLLQEGLKTLPSLQILDSPEHGKKKAIRYGIQHTQNEFIVVTDADCSFHKDWLYAIGSFFEQQKVDLIAGPVHIKNNKSFGQFFQSLDFMSLVGSGAGAITLGNPIMCNGANLAYKKSAFLSVSEELKEQYLSGDDVFLLHAFKNKGYKCKFIKDKRAIVTTQPVKTLKDFFHQRVRWASKSKGYTDKATLFVAWLVFVTNALVIASIPIYYTSAVLFRAIMTGWALKILIDTIFLIRLSRFFELRIKSLPFLMSQLIYPLYILTTVIWAAFGNITWKNRKV